MPRTMTDERAATAVGGRTVELVNAISSVPTARHLVKDDLRAAGIPPALLDNALAVVTELVSNAISHAKPLQLSGSAQGVILRWTILERHVTVDVTDGGGPNHPQLRRPPSAEPDGRGLAIVDALAQGWSVRSENGRVTVHAVVGPAERSVDERSHPNHE